MRAESIVDEGPIREARVRAEAEPSLTELIAELSCAGLVTAEVGDDGDVTYALTPHGQLTARLMAMSRDVHARVLLGALMSASQAPN